MFFGLLNLFFLDDWLWWGLWFFINFTDKINTTDRRCIADRFFCLNFLFIINFGFRFCLLLRFLNYWCIQRFVWLWRRLTNWLCWLGWWLCRFDCGLINRWFRLLCGFLLLSRSSYSGFHSTTEQQIIHVSLEIGSFSICIKCLFFIFWCWLIIIINT